MKSQELVEGKVYFLCMFSNAQHPIPEITPYIYTGFDEGVYHFRTPERHIISGALRKTPNVDETELNDYCNSDDMAVASEEDLELFCTFKQMQKFVADLEQHEKFGLWY